MKKIFLQSKISGDYNVNTYSLKKEKSTRNKSVTLVHLQYDDNNEDEVMAEIKRGKTFATRKDGLLLGTIYSLTKLGTLTYSTN